MACNGGSLTLRPVSTDSTDQVDPLPAIGEPEETATPSATAKPPPPTEPQNSPKSPVPSLSPPTLPQPVELVREDLAIQLGIAPDDIELVTLEEVIWPDTCLGLPAPELCAPGETPGYRVTLVAQGQEYTYHTDKGDTFRSAGP